MHAVDSAETEHPLLAALPGDARARVERSMRTESRPAGADIVAQGTLSTDFFLILRGSVEVVQDGAVSAVLEAGSFFGESGALDAGPGYALARNATVRTREPVELAVIPEDDFADVMRSVPAFRDAVYAALDARR
jgi:CRP-like cAMP-binding protein